MPEILILESNPPQMVARGASAAAPFLRSFAAIAPKAAITLAAPYAAPLDPALLAAADGVVVTGSGVDWAVDAPQAAPLRAAMALVLDAGLPVWGSCNGMQLAVLMLGGAVGASPNGREAGFARDMTIHADHPMMAGRRPGFAAPCIHRDEVTRLPECMTLVAGNAHSPVQAVATRSGPPVWGTQYHPECTPADIAAYLTADGAHATASALAGPLLRGELAGFGIDPRDAALPRRAAELAAWIRLLA